MYLLFEMHVRAYNVRHIICDYTITATRIVRPVLLKHYCLRAEGRHFDNFSIVSDYTLDERDSIPGRGK
jgi:hypothetical protein